MRTAEEDAAATVQGIAIARETLLVIRGWCRACRLAPGGRIDVALAVLRASCNSGLFATVENAIVPVVRFAAVVGAQHDVRVGQLPHPGGLQNAVRP
jgi:hypothetical protein